MNIAKYICIFIAKDVKISISDSVLIVTKKITSKISLRARFDMPFQVNNDL